MGQIIYFFAADKAAMLLLVWFMSNGLGVTTQYLLTRVVGLRTNFWTPTWRTPRDWVESVTEWSFFAAMVIGVILYISSETFRLAANHLRGTHTILCILVVVIGWAMEFFPSLEERLNRVGMHGLFWIGLYLLFKFLLSIF